VVEGSEAVGESAGLLDDQVDRFGAAVGDPVGVESGQDVLLPLLEGAAEAGDLGDWAGGEGRDDVLGTSAALGRAVGLVDRAQLLVGMPGDGDLEAGVAGDQARVQFRGLLVG
jgi:hypothetical protein